MGAGGRARAEGAETLVEDRQEDGQQDNTENMGSAGQTANKPAWFSYQKQGRLFPGVPIQDPK